MDTKITQKELQQESDEEEHQTGQQYEQERFTEDILNILKMMRIKQIDSLMIIMRITRTNVYSRTGHTSVVVRLAII